MNIKFCTLHEGNRKAASRLRAFSLCALLIPALLLAAAPAAKSSPPPLAPAQKAIKADLQEKAVPDAKVVPSAAKGAENADAAGGSKPAPPAARKAKPATPAAPKVSAPKRQPKSVPPPTKPTPPPKPAPSASAKPATPKVQQQERPIATPTPKIEKAPDPVPTRDEQAVAGAAMQEESADPEEQEAALPRADAELRATAKLFFQSLIAGVPEAVAELADFPFNLDGKRQPDKGALIAALGEGFERTDLSRMRNFGVELMPLELMLERHGTPPRRLGEFKKDGSWVGIANLGGQGYVAVFHKVRGRWAAFAYTD